MTILLFKFSISATDSSYQYRGVISRGNVSVANLITMTSPTPPFVCCSRLLQPVQDSGDDDQQPPNYCGLETGKQFVLKYQVMGVQGR